MGEGQRQCELEPRTALGDGAVNGRLDGVVTVRCAAPWCVFVCLYMPKTHTDAIAKHLCRPHAHIETKYEKNEQLL